MKEPKYTTIEFELRRMNSVIEEKLSHFKPVRYVSVEDKIYSVFKSSSRTKIEPAEEERMRIAIHASMRDNEPIQVSFLWALFWMSQSSWKFLQPHLVEPRLADYWAFYWLELINQKIKKVYEPGCHFCIIDEFVMVKNMGWSRRKASIRENALRPIIEKFPSISVIELPNFAELPEPGELCNGEILSTILSTPKLFQKIDGRTAETITANQYLPGERDWPLIWSRIPKSIQEEAKAIKNRMNQLGAARRTSGWLEREIFRGRPFIDAAMISCGRWCPDIWSLAMPQHGGSVLDISHKNRYSISIIPESRLVDNHTPVVLPPNPDGEALIFYWAHPEAKIRRKMIATVG